MSIALTKQSAGDNKWIDTVCYMCQNACNIRVHVANGVVLKIEGNPNSIHNQTRICAKGNAAIMSLYNPNRLKKPVKRTNPKKGRNEDPGWVEITWEEALNVVVSKLKKIREEDPRKLLILSFDAQGFGDFGKAWGAAFGTPNVNPGSSGWYCGNGLHPIAYLAHGSYYMEPDFDYCRYLLLIGSGMGIPTYHENPMGLGPKVAEGRQKRGLKIVAIDPVGSIPASKADEWLPIIPGTDASFALAMLNVLLNELQIYDREFLQKYTNAPYLIGNDGYYLRDKNSGEPLVWCKKDNQPVPYHLTDEPAIEGSFRVDGKSCSPSFQLLKDHVKKYDPEGAAKITSIPAETIRRIAREFGEAASIGSTIMIKGCSLPYRPVAVDWSRGAIAHKHAFQIGWAIQLLNTIVGAIDVPGGHMGISVRGANWMPSEGPDGLLVPGKRVSILGIPYPPKKASKPNTIEAQELFPAAVYARPMFPELVLDPKKYGLDYEPEMIIQCRTNMMMTAADPDKMEKAFAKIPFMVSFATNLDETAELADIVFPDAHVLERLDPMPNMVRLWVLSGEGDWYWTIRQPVVKPPEEVKPWAEVMFEEIAQGVGFSADLYMTLNSSLNLKEPFKLDPKTRYSFEEIVSRYYQSLFGKEHDLAWFKQNGILYTSKSLQEAYPRPFIKARIPVYLEHLLRQKEQVTQVTQELGLDFWDTSDYSPLPDWRPCPAYETGGDYDLWGVNYIITTQAHSTSADNAWLNEIDDLYPGIKGILMNTATAQKKGLKDGDIVVIETSEGIRAEGKVSITECIHPEVVAIGGCQGHWARARTEFKEYRGINFNSLIKHDFKYLDFVSSALDACLKVKIFKK